MNAIGVCAPHQAACLHCGIRGDSIDPAEVPPKTVQENFIIGTPPCAEDTVDSEGLDGDCWEAQTHLPASSKDNLAFHPPEKLVGHVALQSPW